MDTNTTLDEAIAAAAEFYNSVTQREWLTITNKLDRSRTEIGEDGALRALVSAWIKQKRETGATNWDELLDSTDAEVLARFGITEDDYEGLTDSDDDQEG